MISKVNMQLIRLSSVVEYLSEIVEPCMWVKFLKKYPFEISHRVQLQFFLIRNII